MNSLSLALAYLRHRLLGTVLSLVTFASGIALIVALMLVNAQLNDEFRRNLAGIDLVVGAKGSPLQLILSSVFHLDAPTGNIPLAEAERLQRHPMIRSAIPLALGDNYDGFRIVGTTPAYIEHYRGTIAAGRVFAKEMEAVVGSEVAARHGTKPGDAIVGAHGLVNSDDLHGDSPYTVTGVLAPTGTVLDRLVLTPVESVWHVHEHGEEHDHEHGEGHADGDEHEHGDEDHDEHAGKELTALLLTYRSPLGASTMPRMVNASGAMQAASPAVEVARLTRLTGAGTATLKALGWFVVALAGFGIFAALYNAMKDRRYDLALMRSLGAPPRRLLGLVLAESMILSLGGALIGLIAGHGLVFAFAAWLSAERHIAVTGALFLPEELLLVATGLGIGILAAILPAARVYRIDIVKTLAAR